MQPLDNRHEGVLELKYQHPKQKGVNAMKYVLEVSGPSGNEKEFLEPGEDPMVAYDEALNDSQHGDTVTLYIEEDGALGILEREKLI